MCAADYGGDAMRLASDEEILGAVATIHSSPMCRVTPLLPDMEHLLLSDDNNDGVCWKGVKLYLKMENMQITARGVANQFANLPSDVLDGHRSLVTMSGGNYGKTFAHAIAHKRDREGFTKISGLVLLPTTVPTSRIHTIQSYGVSTECVHVSALEFTARQYVTEKDMFFLHSFNDHRLISAYTSVGDELIKSMSLSDTPIDVVLVSCGGGGLLSGVATAIKRSGSPFTRHTRVYGVEPVGACAMSESFRAGKAITLDKVNTVAAGLAAPFAGDITYAHCCQYVDDILVVSDEQIISTTKLLYESGIVAEPAGSASLAALKYNKVPPGLASGESTNVICIITGSNITPQEMTDLQQA